jgi:pimeloyl-ACP methyl ester carboxylesterase
MPSSRLRALLAVCVVALVALAACSSGGERAQPPEAGSSSTAERRPETGTLDWDDCGEGECATLRVPLDASDPTGEQIELALAREPAAKADERIGSLVINPGGPGSPGTDFVQTVAAGLPESITDRFDIVGWDPRGSGHSSPVDCGTKLDYLFDVDTAPDDDGERTALAETSARFARACEQRSGDLLGHIASIETVHDMERIRAALGDEKLTYLGLSYGTYLGALYAQEYPDRVRALVLDGAVDPALPLDAVSLEQAKGFERSLDAFLEDCARRKRCAFHNDGDPRAALDALRARVEREPIEGRDGRHLGPTRLDVALAAPLYAGAGGYNLLARALADAQDGKPDGLLRFFDDYMLRDASGSYAAEWPTFIAVSCADGPGIDPDEITPMQERAARQAPYFGASNIGLGAACAYWPVPPVNAVPTAVTAPDSPPLVVVGTTGDPATPVAWADGLARELGNARLITVEGTTHTSSLDANPCLDRALTAYLVRLEPPNPGLRCPA